MLQAVGLNVKLRMVEVAEWVDIYTKPFAEDRPPTLHQTMHDNNNGDAVFTVFFKYHSDGAQSVLSDKELDGLIQSATVARATSAPSSGRRPSGGSTRTWWRTSCSITWSAIPVGLRVKFTPSISTNSELQLAQIKFAE